jgi:hypothetical protein
MKNMGREIPFFQERVTVTAKLILQKTPHSQLYLLIFCPPWRFHPNKWLTLRNSGHQTGENPVKEVPA